MEKLTLVYYYVALFATVLYIAKMFLFSVFGGDTEVHTDFNTSFETDTSFDFISVQSVLAFLMGFGWMGLTCVKVWHLPKFAVILVPIVFGLLLMFISAYLMFCIKKLNKHIVKDLSKSINMIGKAYTAFAPNGEGQIELNFNSQLTIYNAVNVSDAEIKAFEEVKVVKFENNKLYIEKI